jgi:diguanylate cyclase (GGDEF)-like protein
MKCGHLSGDGASLCIPMTAHGEMVGLLALEAPEATALGGHTSKFARSAAEQISLACSAITVREELRRQAVRDSLTGLFNRRYAEESLVREIGRASRRSGNMSLMLIDVDHFKDVNDALGHPTGDRLLREIATVIAGSTRAEDVAARFGGDEFIVILSETRIANGLERAEEIARKVRSIAIVHPGNSGGPSLSIGVSEFPGDGSDAASLIAAADEALYLAKQRGRDRVERVAPSA